MREPIGLIDNETARQLTSNPSVIWYQKFQLSNDVATPGVHDLEVTLARLGLPQDLTGMSVLDVGTNNGGATFIAERRGADRLVAVDIFDEHVFGFAETASALGSKAEFIQASVYELSSLLDETFDVVLFMGVLYHLRHPLLAIDALRRITGGRLYLETEIAASKLARSYSEFYADEYAGDRENWFIPTTDCVIDWLNTSGFDARLTATWPDVRPTRAAFRAEISDGLPKWCQSGHEQSLFVKVDQGR